MKELLQKIGQFFSGLFNAAQRTWNQLPQNVKTAMVDASGILKIFNVYIDKTPEEIKALIETSYPGLTVEKLSLVATAWNLSFTEGDYVSVVGAIQEHLRPLEGNFWANASDTFASLLAAINAPDGTHYSIISMLMSWVYHRFVR